MNTQAYEAGRRAFIPGWTNHLDHNPYAKGSQEYADFAKGWDRESSVSEHCSEIE